MISRALHNMEAQEVERVAQLLSKLEPGFLPYPVFEQIARLVALPIVEIIPLRLSDDDQVQVLLIDRGPDDPLWPNLLHTPGTVVRADDLHTGESHDWQAFKRIFHEELQDTPVTKPQYIGSIFHKSKRGAEQAQLYYVEVTGEPRVGSFFDVANLPDNLIDSQLQFIALAAQQFTVHKKTS